MNTEEKLKFLEGLLIDIHTYNWTGNPKIRAVMEAIGSYSYAHTNSNAGDEYEPDVIFERFAARINEIKSGPKQILKG